MIKNVRNSQEIYKKKKEAPLKLNSIMKLNYSILERRKN